MVDGSNMAIVTLLGVTVFMLGIVAAFIASIARRIERHRRGHEASPMRRTIGDCVSSCLRVFVVPVKSR